MKTQQGFVLIGLMALIILFITLAAVALTTSQDHIARYQMAKALEEVSSYRDMVDGGLAAGQIGKTVLAMGQTTSRLSHYGVIAFFNPTTGEGSLEFELGDMASRSIAGTVIVLERNGAGDWNCRIKTEGVSAFKPGFLPAGCPA